MQVVNFSISNVLAERKVPKGKVELRNNIVIRKVASTPIPGVEKPAITIHFVYNVDYSPGVGVINIFCAATAIVEEEEGKAIVDQWEKTKQVSQKMISPMLTFVMMKCRLQSYYLSDLVSLPPPFPIPDLNPTVESIEELKKRKEAQEASGSSEEKEQKEIKPEKKKK